MKILILLIMFTVSIQAHAKKLSFGYGTLDKVYYDSEKWDMINLNVIQKKDLPTLVNKKNEKLLGLISKELIFLKDGQGSLASDTKSYCENYKKTNFLKNAKLEIIKNKKRSVCLLKIKNAKEVVVQYLTLGRVKRKQKKGYFLNGVTFNFKKGESIPNNKFFSKFGSELLNEK